MTPRLPYPINRNRSESCSQSSELYHPYATQDRNVNNGCGHRSNRSLNSQFEGMETPGRGFYLESTQPPDSQPQDFSQSFASRTPRRQEEPIFAQSNPVALGEKLLRLRSTRTVNAQEELATAVENVGRLDMASVVEELQQVEDQRMAKVLVGLAAYNAQLTSKLSALEIKFDRYKNAASSHARNKEPLDGTYDYRNIKDGIWTVRGFFGLSGTIDLRQYVMELVSDSWFLKHANATASECINYVTRYVIARLLPAPQYQRYVLRTGLAVDANKQDFPPEVMQRLSGMHAQACGVDENDANLKFFEIDGATRKCAKNALDDLRRSSIRLPPNAVRRNQQETAGSQRSAGSGGIPGRYDASNQPCCSHQG